MITPRLGITMGDPSGVGPETIVKAWQSPQVHAACSPIVIGSADVLRRAVDLLDAEITVVTVNSVAEISGDPTTLPCLEIDVRSNRLNRIIEGNVHDIPIFRLSTNLLGLLKEVWQITVG